MYDKHNEVNLTKKIDILYFFRGKVRNIRLGEFDLTSTTANSNRRDFSVVETITHPSFKSNSFYHDIGLIRLNESVGTFNNYIRPICLPTGSFKDNADIVVPAWRLAEAGRSPSNMLQRVELTQLDDERCKRFYGTTSELNNGVLQEIQFCAYANDAKQDVCYVSLFYTLIIKFLTNLHIG